MKPANEVDPKTILARRAEFSFLHPLYTGEVILPTEPINDLYLAVYRAVVLREIGVCFTGHSGAGKSSALDAIDAMLRVRMPTLCVINYDNHSHQVPSVRAFFKHFLNTIKHSNLCGETYDLRQRVVNWMVDEAHVSGLNVILLLADEAQEMKIEDFNFLKDVFNDLRRESVQLITIMMAQEPDFGKVIEKMKTARRLDLLGRFAMGVRHFRSFDCKEDLLNIMLRIDDSIYPEGSGITWTQFYFPEAYAAGFRLKNQLTPFMASIAAGAPKKRPTNFEYPARQIFLTIRIFMMDCARYDAPAMVLPPEAWSEAVEKARLQMAMEQTNSVSQEKWKVER